MAGRGREAARECLGPDAAEEDNDVFVVGALGVVEAGIEGGGVGCDWGAETLSAVNVRFEFDRVAR